MCSGYSARSRAEPLLKGSNGLIQIKSQREIELMRQSGKLTAAARRLAASLTVPGATTGEIDREVKKFIESHGASPSFLGYNGFTGSVCISVNEEVIHGIPGKKRIEDGDIVSLDLGAYLNGYHGDCATTVATPSATKEDRELIEVTRQSFFEGLKFAKIGYRISDISWAIQQYVESCGYSVVRDFVGHGLGRKLHEAPEVPNFGQPGRGPRLTAGMTIAVEPMVNIGDKKIRILDDGWTVVTSDGSRSAHYENTILITSGEPEILTREEE